MDIPWLGIIVSIIGLLIWRQLRKTQLARWKAITLTIGLTFLVGTLFALLSIRLGSTTTEYGNSCSKSEYDRNLQLLMGYTDAREAGNYEMEFALLSEFHTSIQNLDLPTLASDQILLIDATNDYLSVLGEYIESGNRDFTKVHYPFVNSAVNFLSSFEELCAKK